MQDSASFAPELSLPTPDSMKQEKAETLQVVPTPIAKPDVMDAQKIKSLLPVLTFREAEVVAQVVKGQSNKECAAKLFVEEKTVKFHLTNIYKKVAVKQRAQLIVMLSSLK